MRKMVAIGKLEYGTRRLRAGDEFAADTDEHVTILTLAGLAKKKEETKAEAAPESRSDETPAEAEWMNSLRQAYETKSGRPADKRWGARRLQDLIEELN